MLYWCSPPQNGLLNNDTWQYMKASKQKLEGNMLRWVICRFVQRKKLADGHDTHYYRHAFLTLSMYLFKHLATPFFHRRCIYLNILLCCFCHCRCIFSKVLLIFSFFTTVDALIRASCNASSFTTVDLLIWTFCYAFRFDTVSAVIKASCYNVLFATIDALIWTSCYAFFATVDAPIWTSCYAFLIVTVNALFWAFCYAFICHCLCTYLDILLYLSFFPPSLHLFKHLCLAFLFATVNVLI